MTERQTDIYRELFSTFFKIGLFTLGGGYAMIPIIEREVVDKHQWMKREEMLDLIAVAQSCPGVFAINISIFVGYKLRMKRGALCTAVGTALPSFLIILLIAMFFRQFQDNTTVASIFKGIRPAVVALIVAPVITTARAAKIGWKTVIIPIAVAGLIYSGLPYISNPIVFIILGALGGYVYYIMSKQQKVKNAKEKEDNI